MSTSIDWGFIGSPAIEGTKLQGYVPDAAHSHSGVTVASGVDLGNMTRTTFKALPPALQTKVRPYLGVTGEAAAKLLAEEPLTVTQADVAALNATAHDTTIAALTAAYNAACRNPMAFGAIGPGPQTVLASVTFQYGTPWVRCPHFWAAAIMRDWQKVIEVLRDFGDQYQERHDHEAEYLSTHLG